MQLLVRQGRKAAERKLQVPVEYLERVGPRRNLAAVPVV